MGTRITFRYKNDDKPEVLPTHSKAIRCWEEGFCIAVYEPESHQVVVVEEHLFEEDYPLKGKMHLLSEAEKQWPTGGEMRLVCFNHPNTQIPQHLYNEADKNLYLQLLTATPYRFTPVEELVEPFGLYNLSGWDRTCTMRLCCSIRNAGCKAACTCFCNCWPDRKGDGKLWLLCAQPPGHSCR